MHLLPSALIFCTLLSSISPFAPHPSMLRSQLLRRTLPTSSLTRLFSSLDDQIATKGDEIRKLKESGLDKSSLKPHIAELLALKAQLSPPPVAPSAPAPPAAKPSTPPPSNANSDKITPRATDYSAWYSDIIRHSALAESSATRGAMIIKPWGMSVWESLKRDLDDRIASKDVENCYFPLLIPKSFLSKEAEHVEGFAKECAVVTHHRLCTDPNNPNNLIPDPASLLEEPLIIRPTSETIIWSSFQKWISSHRDLPFKINQWANVLRWELRTRPFLRTSEFLWQEGHTAHATAAGANADAKEMILEYSDFVSKMLAMPCVVGVKSPAERFAGAVETFTIETVMGNGWALQSGTSHDLGQTFGKAFDVKFQNKNEQEEIVYGTSWGVTTRLIGAMIMTHSDDEGLVLPPTVAPKQVVVVPIAAKKNDVEGQAALDQAVAKLVAELQFAGLRVKVDDRDYIRNGAKYYEWERKGVPLRIEIGPRDVKKDVCVFKWRVGADGKEEVELEGVGAKVKEDMEKYQQKLLESALERMTGSISMMVNYPTMRDALANDEAGTFPGAGLFLVPWKCDEENEDKIKEECKATIRCYPLDVNGAGVAEGKTCFYSGEPATHMALFGRAF